MSESFVLAGELRADTGKGASRRLRRTGVVPAVVYGGESAPTAVSLRSNEVIRALGFESFYSQIVTLDVAGNKISAVLKDVQRHPYKNIILHMDFQRVEANSELHVHVPLHFLNEETCEGVKNGGGSISHTATELHVACLPKDLPEFIEVDLQNLDIGASLHISDLALPEGVRSIDLAHGDDRSVVTVHRPAGGAAAAEDEEES